MKHAWIVAMGLAGCAHGRAAAPAPAGGPAPAGVRSAAEGLLGTGVAIHEEHEDGKTQYEATAPTKLEVELSATGALQKTEIAIPLGALPAAVVAAASAKGTPREAEVVITPAGVVFEVEVAGAGAGELELTIDAAGTVLASETETGHDSD